MPEAMENEAGKLFGIDVPLAIPGRALFVANGYYGEYDPATDAWTIEPLDTPPPPQGEVR